MIERAQVLRGKDADRQSPAWIWCLIVAAIFVFTHIALFIHDAGRPEGFLEGDRGLTRIEKMKSANAAPSNNGTSIYDRGPPGDYVVHAVLDKIGGQRLVIGTQILVTLGSVLAVMHMASRIGGPAWSAPAAGFLAFAAPGMLMNPHLLVTEPWSAFCMTLGCAACVVAMLSNTVAGFSIGFLSFAAASFFRPGNLLVPVVAAVALVLLLKTRRQTAAILCLMSYGIYPGLWLILRFLATGDVGLGPSDFDLNTNYWLRASRVAMPGDAFDPYVDQDKMPFGPFVSVMLAHPLATMKTFLVDAANLFLNSGTNQVFGHYLHVINTPEDIWFFHNLLDSGGFFAVIQSILGLGISFVVIFVIYTIPQLLTVASYVVLPVSLRSKLDTCSRAALFLWAVTVASLLGVFAAGGVRWTQRSSVEPVSAVLVVVMIGIGLDRLRSTRTLMPGRA